MKELKSNRDLFDDKLYPEGGYPQGHDTYVLFRKKEGITELLCCGADIMYIDNLRDLKTHDEDGWEYFYLDSDTIHRDIS